MNELDNILKEKCDNCRLWTFECEFDGQSRKVCMNQNYKFFKPKALGYSQRRQRKNNVKS